MENPLVSSLLEAQNRNLRSKPTSVKPEDDALDISEIMAFDFKMADIEEIDIEELINFKIDWDENK